MDLPPSHSSPPPSPLSKDIVHGKCCLLGLTKLLSDLHYDETPSKPCGEWWPIELRSQDKKKIPLDPTNFFYCLCGYKGTHESKLTAIIDGKKNQIIHSLMPSFRVKQTPPPPQNNNNNYNNNYYYILAHTKYWGLHKIWVSS